MEKRPLYPKWLYNFNHWLMLISLGFLIFMLVFGFLIFLPFNKFFSDGFVFWLDDVFVWAAATALALFAASSKIYVDGFADYKIEIKPDDKPEEK